MRRKVKYIRNGALLFGSIGLSRNLFLQSEQLKQNGQPFNWDTVDKLSALKSLFKWGAAGALGGLAYYDLKVWHESKLPFHPDSYLHKVLAREHMKSDPASFNRFLSLRTQIKEDLNQEFCDSLAYVPRDAGSFAKRTAILSNYDLDILLIFRYNSYYSLKEMYYAVFDAVKRLYGNTGSVTKKGSAITISITRGGYEFIFDIIPGRLLNGSKSRLTFYKRAEYFWNRSGSKMANVSLQRRLTMYKPEERQVIKLLKLYKDLNGLNIPSVAIEQMVITAMSDKQFGIDSSITDNLLNAMDFIAGKVLKNRLNEVSNSNQNLLDGVSWWDKQRMSDLLIRDIHHIEQNPRYLKEIFN